VAVAVLVASGGAAAMDATPGRAQTAAERSQLANGLTVVSVQRPDAETVAITLAIRAGARFEREDTASATKFIERMYLQGTPSRPDRDAVMRTVTSRGGTLGVGAGWEFLDFGVVMAPEDVDVALDLLTDLLANSLFDSERLEHQRGLILRDLAERRDNPTARAFDLFYQTIYRDHELRFLPSGSVESAERIDRETILRHRDARIVPSNIVAGVVSPLSHAEVLARVEGTLGSLPAAPPPSVAGQAPPKASAQEVQYAAGRNQAMVILGGPTPGLSHEDRHPLWLLQTVLGPGGGRLFYDIRDAHGMAYDTSMRLALTAETGSIMAYAGTDPANVAEVTRLLREHLARVREELVSETELENAIGYLVGGTVVGLESGGALAGQLAHNIALGLPLTTAELEADLRAVTREDIRRVAREYLDPGRLTLVVVAPGG
jgi:predicted Zn-dependent peptidase